MSEEFNNIPALALLSALTSRLVQIQSTRYTEQSENVQSIETYSENARLFWLAEWMIRWLMEKTLEGNSGYYSLERLYDNVQEEQMGVTLDELRMVARFFSIDCEFHYYVNTSLLSSRSITKLLDFHTRSDRVKLTKYGRILNRVSGLQQDWLYEDKNVEKILRAINNGEFNRVESLATEIMTTLGFASTEITEIRENASYDDMAKAYYKQRNQFSETIRLCLNAIHQSLDRLDARDVRTMMADYLQANSSSHITIKYLKDLIIEVASSCEMLSRNFTGLISLMQADRTPRLGILNFKHVIDKFVNSDIGEESLACVINDSFGWRPEVNLFSVLDLEEKLSFTRPEPAAQSVRFNQGSDHQILSWLDKNKDKIITFLKNGPQRFSDLLVFTASEGLIENLADIFDLFGAVIDPVKLDERLELTFTLSSAFDFTEIANAKVATTQVTLSLKEYNNDTQ